LAAFPTICARQIFGAQKGATKIIACFNNRSDFAAIIAVNLTQIGAE
jgi:hypothetical protein